MLKITNKSKDTQVNLSKVIVGEKLELAPGESKMVHPNAIDKVHGHRTLKSFEHLLEVTNDEAAGEELPPVVDENKGPELPPVDDNDQNKEDELPPIEDKTKESELPPVEDKTEEVKEELPPVEQTEETAPAGGESEANAE